MSDSTESTQPRYSATPLPPYSYVPGHAPHPVSDPAGHMHGQPHEPAPPLDPTAWRQSSAYLYGVDLFNHGYYWEAHEAWESLWHAADRTGTTATWLKALIKLTAAGVKAREGNAAGAVRHARRARELATQTRASLNDEANDYCGLRIDEVDDAARLIAEQAAREYAVARPALLLPISLRLVDVADDE
jgi:predicted metal-dependent hydrolase